MSRYRLLEGSCAEADELMQGTRCTTGRSTFEMCHS